MTTIVIITVIAPTVLSESLSTDVMGSQRSLLKVAWLVNGRGT